MAKPSITYWHRVEPTPRSDSLVRGLEAAVRDPLWFLTRQWQMGEFRGEDSGSPASVSFRARQSRFESWSAGGKDPQPLDGRAPLEALVEAEHVSPNWAIAVEIGQMLARMLATNGAGTGTIELFRIAFPVPTPADLSALQRRDDALVRFLRVCGRRSIDGLAVLSAAIAAAPAVPPSVGVPAGGETIASQAALASFIDWASAAYGRIGSADGPAWRPDRLDYDVAVAARTAAGNDVQMRAEAGLHGEFDWYAFDETGRGRSVDSSATSELSFSLFPTAVSFSGMPNSRWWQFEDARFNWTNVDTDRREIAKAMVLDFMLVQGNDWFLVPFGQAVGSLITVDQLLVKDVFGDLTLVARADTGAAEGRARWTMYSTAVAGKAGEGLAEYFILAPSALRTTVDGPDLEEVRFLRDEQANLIWAVEARAENGVGRPWAGHERAVTIAEELPPSPATDAPLRYRLQTTVPVHWIPFPPVQTDATRRAVALERAAMQRIIDGALTRVEPVGRVLRPTNLDDPDVYRVREEEVTRSGTRILRADRRTRWLDGSTHAWISRRRRAGLWGRCQRPAL